MEANKLLKGWVDGVLSILIVAFVTILAIDAASAQDDNRLFLEAAFFFSLAAIFCAAYFWPTRLFLFKLLDWLCKTWSFPQKKIMTIVYSFIFFLFGSWLFYRWLFGIN